MIDTYRGRGEALLVLDAGDALPAPPVGGQEQSPYDRARAESMLQGYGLLGVDGLAPGEAELALGREPLVRLARQASLTLLAANLPGGGFSPRRTFALASGGGTIRAGVFGLFALPAAEPPLPARLKLRPEDPIAAARAQVKALREEGVELIVMLGHLGMPRAREVARAVAGIHLGIVAHSGYRTMEPERVPETGTLLVESGRRGQSLGRIEVRLGDGWGAGATLVDDSRRFVLELEARAEIERVRKGLQAATNEVLRRRIEPSLERARLLAKQLAATRPPPGPHTVIATLTELDDTAPENAAMRAFAQGARARWPAPAPVAPQLHVIQPARPR